jgi:O-antigen/teichoic acid export membrane protein
LTLLSLTKLRQVVPSTYRDLIWNVGARFSALVSLALATFILARAGGPTAVGIYALMRVLPSLVGVVSSAGLPGAVTYFFAGDHRENRRLPATVLSIALVGGTGGAILWLAASPVLQRALFSDLSTGLVAVSAILVLTRVLVATAKSCSQGRDDLPGANRVIVTEELMFLPMYGIVVLIGVGGLTAVTAGMIVADLATLSLAWARLARRGFFSAAFRPSRPLAREIASYGLRAQTGGVISLLNLRLDFIVLSVLAGPAVLGVYAVASKFAELVRIPGMSVTYVLYPRFAKAGPVKAAAWARKLVTKAALITGATVVPLFLSASFLIPTIYGSKFESAVLPAQIILVGLVTQGIGAVGTAFLYGVGRPGANSLAVGVGLAVTVVLDLLLIPPFHATGAAVASAVAYTVNSLVLLWFLLRAGGPAPGIGATLPRTSSEAGTA